MKSIALCKNLEVLFALPRLARKKAWQLACRREAGREPRRALVCCIAHLGDPLCALPALHAAPGLAACPDRPYMQPRARAIHKEGALWHKPIAY